MQTDVITNDVVISGSLLTPDQFQVDSYLSYDVDHNNFIDIIIGDKPLCYLKNKKENEAYEQTDAGNLDRFTMKFLKQFIYVTEKEEWYIYDGKRWIPDIGSSSLYSAIRLMIEDIKKEADEEADRIMKMGDEDALEEVDNCYRWYNICQGSARINALMKLASMSPFFCISAEQFNRNQDQFNVENGTIDLTTGNVLPHKYSDLISKIAPVEYDPNAQCPFWIDTINKVFQEDKELIDYVQKVMGYTMTGSTKEQCFFYNYGKGRNGKTTVLETVFDIFGDYSSKLNNDSIMAGNKRSPGGPSGDIAKLKGVRMILGSEVDDGNRLNESLLKDMTGGDTISARFLWEGDIEFKLCGKLWMFGNYQPHVRGQDYGIKRRIKMIPYLHTFTNPDPTISDKLKSEYSGILNWLIEGCLKWRNEGLLEPEIVTKMTEEYFEDNDTMGKFLSEYTEKVHVGSVEFKTLYEHYKTFNENGYVLSKTKFSRELKDRNYEVARGVGNKMFVWGIKIISD